MSGSPLKIIPRSPTQETGAASSGDEDDDMDEDLLYLRLIALRSLASEDKKPEETEAEGDNELAVEMRELLEEAEVAANENGDIETGKQTDGSPSLHVYPLSCDIRDYHYRR